MSTVSSPAKMAFHKVRPRRSVFIAMGLLWFLVIQYYARVLLGLPEDIFLFSILDTLLDAFMTPLDLVLQSVANPVRWGDFAQISVTLLYSYLFAILLANAAESVVNRI